MYTHMQNIGNMNIEIFSVIQEALIYGWQIILFVHSNST